MTLLAVPNVSEGRDAAVLGAIGDAFAAGGARVLDVHADPDHHRAVFTLAGEPGALAAAVADGARVAIAQIDLDGRPSPPPLHPHVGAMDVAPVVHLDDARRGAAAAEALVLADRVGLLGVPVYLYGALAGGRTRAQLRAGGRAGLRAKRLAPDFGPSQLHRTAGATLVAARPPLVAFNLELAPPATALDAKAIAAAIRESGPEGLPGVRAIGLRLAARGGVAQVSCNVEDHRAVALAALLAAVERHAPVAEAELVGLAPAAAFDGWPDRVTVRNRATIEDRLG